MTSPNRDKMLELADRCERAEGPDFEIDAAIAVASGLYVREKRGKDRQEWFYPTAAKGFRKSTTPYGLDRLPTFTASIDAALTLVPEGWSMGNLSQPDPVRRESQAYALVAENYVEKGEEPWDEFREVEEGRAATPALALCVAALKARSHASQGEVE